MSRGTYDQNNEILLLTYKNGPNSRYRQHPSADKDVEQHELKYSTNTGVYLKPFKITLLQYDYNLYLIYVYMFHMIMLYVWSPDTTNEGLHLSRLPLLQMPIR